MKDFTNILLMPAKGGIVDFSPAQANRWEAKIMHKARNEEELLEMMLLGLTWVQEDASKPLAGQVMASSGR